MKTFFASALVLGLWAAPLTHAGVQLGRESDRARGEQVCVYKDINYFGAEQCYRVGEEINNLGARNNSISSIRVYGRATVTVYEKTAFGGHTEQFTSNVADLGKRLMDGNNGWSDRIDPFGSAKLRLPTTARIREYCAAIKHGNRGTASAFTTVPTMKDVRNAGTRDKIFPILQNKAIGTDRSRQSACLVAARLLWSIRTLDTAVKA